MQPPKVDKPFPKGWQSLPFWLCLRIARLTYALPFCKGRATDIRPVVALEIRRLKLRLLEVQPLFDHVWRWNGTWWRPVYRKGEHCRIFCEASKNSIGVEFEDGTRYCTSRHAVQPAPPRLPRKSIFEVTESEINAALRTQVGQQLTLDSLLE